MKTLRWAPLVLSIAFALSPLLSQGFAGFQKDQFPVVLDHWPAQPAGWAFSIWGLIYLWLIAGSVKGLSRDQGGWQAMRPALILSLGLGVFWITVANNAPVPATVMIVLMAAGAITALLRSGGQEPLWLSGPIGLYAGWLTAASAVALAVVISGYGLLAPQVAALLFLGGAVLVALGVQRRVPATLSYPAALGWALIGVLAANSSAEHWPVAALALLGLAALAGQAVALNRR